VIHISQSEVLLVHLALLNFMCLYDMHCGYLGVIKFNIELVVLYFFENLLPLRSFSCFEALVYFSLLVLSSVCLMTSNNLSIGEFDKCLECTSFLGSFYFIFRENYVLYVIICTHVPILRSGMVLFCIL